MRGAGEKQEQNKGGGTLSQKPTGQRAPREEDGTPVSLASGANGRGPHGDFLPRGEGRTDAVLLAAQVPGLGAPRALTVGKEQRQGGRGPREQVGRPRGRAEIKGPLSRSPGNDTGLLVPGQFLCSSRFPAERGTSFRRELHGPPPPGARRLSVRRPPGSAGGTLGGAPCWPRGQGP